MKNHLGRLNLSRGASIVDITDALDADTLDARDDVEARSILLDPLRRRHFERLHRQYEALAVARQLLERPGATDSHRWTERLVEFQKRQLDD